MPLLEGNQATLVTPQIIVTAQQERTKCTVNRSPHQHKNERTLRWGGVDTSIARLHFLLSTLLLKMKHDTTDRFMRDFICGCYGTERFLLLHHTKYDCRPEFGGNTIFRLFWPWSPFANKRRRADVIGSVVSEHVLDLEIQLASRSKEEGENW